MGIACVALPRTKNIFPVQGFQFLDLEVLCFSLFVTVCSAESLMSFHFLVRAFVGRISRVEAFRPEGRGFESRSSCHVGTLGKSLSRSCL